MKTQNLGWAVAGVLSLVLAGMVGSGFQTPAQKIGTVNMAKVFNDSEFVKRQDGELKNTAASRNAIVQFIDAYRMLPQTELEKFKDASVKTPPDNAEIDRIKKAGVAAEQKYRDLQTKANKTDEETKQLAELQRRVGENSAYLQRLNDEMGQELQGQSGKLRADALEKAKAAVAEVGKKEGYTVVLVDEVAPYSANDLTAEALKVMNQKNK